MTMRLRFLAWRDLAAHYGTVFKAAWGQRKAMALPTLRPDEAEFQAAALALQVKPVSPLGRGLAWILMAMVAIAVAWSILGKLDIIVSAAGRIISTDRTKLISSPELGVVRAIRVREGQVVRAGDPLIELDTRQSDAERDRAGIDASASLLQAARARALLQALNAASAPRLGALPEVSPDARADAQRQLDDQWRDYVARRDRLQRELERIDANLSIAAQRARDFEVLAREGDIALHVWTEKEQARLDLDGQARATRAQIDALLAEARKAAQEELTESTRRLQAARQEGLRAQVRSELLVLRAPVDGTVQQLNVHTLGAAVPAAQGLMEIVPAQGPLELELQLENRDVGFVRLGQRAAVKVDAFPYTKYGTVEAEVVRVSRDAIRDEKRGWLYSVHVRLEKPTILIDEGPKALEPGMTAIVDIRTGERRVIEYVLSPLVEHVKESARER